MDNEVGQQDYWLNEVHMAMKQSDPVSHLASRIKDEHEEAAHDALSMAHFDTGPLADLLNGALSEVNWREIAQMWIDDHAPDRVGSDTWRAGDE
jgi:hypothetical protein